MTKVHEDHRGRMAIERYVAAGSSEVVAQLRDRVSQWAVIGLPGERISQIDRNGSTKSRTGSDLCTPASIALLTQAAPCSDWVRSKPSISPT